MLKGLMLQLRNLNPVTVEKENFRPQSETASDFCGSGLGRRLPLDDHGPENSKAFSSIDWRVSIDAIRGDREAGAAAGQLDRILVSKDYGRTSAGL